MRAYTTGEYSKLEEIEISQADKDAYKEMNGKAGGVISKAGGWISALFGKKAKAEEGKDKPNKTDEENKPIE
jgi:hypothetical protein